MKKTQFKLLAERLIKSPLQREAVKLAMLGSLNTAEAERKIYGHVTGTVARDVKRINELLESCKSVCEA